MSPNQTLDFIKKTFTFWDKLSLSEQELILNNIIPVNYKKGEAIHSGDNDCVGILLVQSGDLRTYILSEDGREITLYRLNNGDVCILSASCILKNITFDVHINAETNSNILLLNSTIFQDICDKNIYAENFSYKIVVDRFSDVMWAMQQILFMSFDKRLALFLLDESLKNHTDTLHLTHEQIAKYIGSAREVVSRMLKYFETEGYVTLSRGTVKLINRKALNKLI
jgi:CRP/FNR family transcriptional regulator